jgi:cell division protease FtsH
MGENRWLKNSFVYLIILVAALALFFNYFSGSQANVVESGISTILADAKAGKIKSIDVQTGSSEIIVNYRDAKVVHSRIESGDSITTLLVQAQVPLDNVELKIGAAPAWGGLFNVISVLLPVILMIGFFVFFMRQAQGSNNQAMSFGKSRARMFSGDKPSVTFTDVAGQEEAKQDLSEIVEFLKFPDKFSALSIPRCIDGWSSGNRQNLVVTSCAQVKQEYHSSRFRALNSSKCSSVWVHHWSAICLTKPSATPLVSFSLTKSTLSVVNVVQGWVDHMMSANRRSIRFWWRWTDLIRPPTSLAIAATNRPDVLDPALIRPGRFDRQVVLDTPDVKGRIAVLGVHSKGKPLADDVDLAVIAKLTPGFSGADLANAINEAAILAARRSKKQIGQLELSDAVERVALGCPERRSRVMTEREKLLVSYHEAGHAIAAAGMSHSHMVQKVTIIPRGRAGGYTLFLPEEDSLRYTTASQFNAQLVSALGGRVAEELIFGIEEVTTGARVISPKSHELPRAMVTRFGMSPQAPAESPSAKKKR